MSHAREIQNLKKELLSFTKETREIANLLRTTAKGFHEQYLAIQKANIAGSSAGIVGGTLGAIGFGLSFFTFGASLALSVAGAAIGGAGGLTCGISALTQYGLESQASNDAKKHLEKYEQTRNALIQTFYGIIEILGKEQMDRKFPLLTSFITKFLYGTGKTLWSTAYKLIYQVVSGIRLGKTTAQIVTESGIVAKVSVAGVKGATALGRGLHIAGGVVGVALIPLDIFTLVNSSIETAHGTVPDLSKDIYDLADELMKQCPDDAEIIRMIEDTIRRL